MSTVYCSTRAQKGSVSSNYSFLIPLRLSPHRHLGNSGQTQARTEKEEPQQQEMLVEFAYLLDSDAKHLYDLMRMNTCLQELIQVFSDEVRFSP